MSLVIKPEIMNDVISFMAGRQLDNDISVFVNDKDSSISLGMYVYPDNGDMSYGSSCHFLGNGKVTFSMGFSDSQNRKTVSIKRTIEECDASKFSMAFVEFFGRQPGTAENLYKRLSAHCPSDYVVEESPWVYK